MNDITDLAARVRELEADRDSWRDQADQRVKDWDDMRQRAERAEAKYEDEIQMWRNACELMNRAEAERDALRAGEREWYGKLQAADAENEQLRGMLAGCYAKWREDADPLECEQLCTDIDAALAQEKFNG